MNTLSNSLDENIAAIKKIFENDDTLIIRCFENKLISSIRFGILFIDGMIDNEIIDQDIIKPLIENTSFSTELDLVDNILYRVVFSNNISKSMEVQSIIESLISGDTLIFIDGTAYALIVNARKRKTRGIKEPEGEKILRGPREGFTESLTENLSMIRRKLLTPDLKFKYRYLGRRTNTRICLCYIDGIVNNQILNELNGRLDNIDIDGILASGYIQELIKDSPLSPFKTVGSTERPDIIAAKLLEGRIAIMVDGTPVALTVPHIFIEYFQSNEDYYINFYFSSISRIVRILCFIITVSLPGIFVALITFHQEMLPTPLIISISAARQNVPLPNIIEAAALLFAFEILRETGIRMPSQIGQAFSIVGALVLGQAAVEARFVSAPMVIIVALTGITGFAVPRIKGAAIILRAIFLVASSILGLYGFMFAFVGLLIHLLQIRSYGIPYLYNLTNLNPEDLKDTFIRAPWYYMKYRPRMIASKDIVRKGSGGKNNAN